MGTENETVTGQAQKYKTLVTDIGNEKITAAILNGNKLNIVAAAVGDGGGSYYLPTADMSALVNEVWRGPVASIETDNESANMLNVKIVVPGKAGGFTVRECGIVDDEGDLIAVCNMPDTQKAIITDGIAAALTILMHIVVTNGDALEFSLDPSIDTASATSAAFKIAADAWADAGDGLYRYRAEAVCDEATAMHTPLITMEIASLPLATACGLCPTVETVSGALRFWAMQIPAGEMAGTVMLIGQGGGSKAGDGSYVLPTATAYRLGGVKVGDGLVVDDEGTLSVDVASDEEVNETIDEALGEVFASET